MPYRKPMKISEHPQASSALLEIYDIIFWSDEIGGYDPDKNCGSDEIHEISRVFHRYRMMPEEVADGE